MGHRASIILTLLLSATATSFAGMTRTPTGYDLQPFVDGADTRMSFTRPGPAPTFAAGTPMNQIAGQSAAYWNGVVTDLRGQVSRLDNIRRLQGEQRTQLTTERTALTAKKTAYDNYIASGAPAWQARSVTGFTTEAEARLGKVNTALTQLTENQNQTSTLNDTLQSNLQNAQTQAAQSQAALARLNSDPSSGGPGPRIGYNDGGKGGGGKGGGGSGGGGMAVLAMVAAGGIAAGAVAAAASGAPKTNDGATQRAAAEREELARKNADQRAQMEAQQQANYQAQMANLNDARQQAEDKQTTQAIVQAISAQQKNNNNNQDTAYGGIPKLDYNQLLNQPTDTSTTPTTVASNTTTAGNVLDPAKLQVTAPKPKVTAPPPHHLAKTNKKKPAAAALLSTLDDQE